MTNSINVSYTGDADTTGGSTVLTGDSTSRWDIPVAIQALNLTGATLNGNGVTATLVLGTSYPHGLAIGSTGVMNVASMTTSGFDNATAAYTVVDAVTLTYPNGTNSPCTIGFGTITLVSQTTLCGLVIPNIQGIVLSSTQACSVQAILTSGTGNVITIAASGTPGCAPLAGQTVAGLLVVGGTSTATITSFKVINTAPTTAGVLKIRTIQTV